MRRPTATIFIPDVLVAPTAYGEHLVDDPRLAIFSDPLPFVAEVWSPATGAYDVETKTPIYRHRGDLEIWRLHPFAQTLTRWVRQSDASYLESEHRGGPVTLAALPGVTLDLDRLFTP